MEGYGAAPSQISSPDWRPRHDAIVRSQGARTNIYDAFDANENAIS